MEYFDYTGQVSCIDSQIAELEARREAVINGYCFIGYAPQPRVVYVEELKDAKEKDDEQNQRGQNRRSTAYENEK